MRNVEMRLRTFNKKWVQLHQSVRQKVHRDAFWRGLRAWKVSKGYDLKVSMKPRSIREEFLRDYRTKNVQMAFFRKHAVTKP